MEFTNKIAYCKIEFPNVGEVDFLKDLNIPVIFEPVLDETLDTCTIRLSDLRGGDYPSVNVSKAFEPDSVVRIGFEGQQTEIRMRIAHDDTKMQRKDDTPWRSWTHVIQLIEETKHTERESVDTLTFTNPIERKYDAQADAEWDSKYYRHYTSTTPGVPSGWVESSSTPPWKPPAIMSLQSSKTISICDNASQFAVDDDYELEVLKITVSDLNGKLVGEYLHKGTRTGNSNQTRLTSKDEYMEIKFDTEGEFLIQFYLEFLDDRAFVGTWYKIEASTYIFVGNVEHQLTNYTLADVINRLLSVTPLKKKGEKNRYKFDEQQLAELAKEEAPEFAFTGHTLFEALLLVAQYKNSFPYLKGDTISFRPLWNGKMLTAADLPPANEEVNSSDINQYCTYIESEVQNLVGINNSRKATVIEPYTGGYRTTRSNAGSEISEDTAVIPTDYNIYQSIALKMGYTNGKEVGEITPYVYEEGEYNGLSETSGTYPNSKAYAIKWQQMGQNYTELAHRINKVDKLSKAFERPAISNVLYAMTGEKDDSSLMAYLKNLVGIQADDSFADLMFRAEYIPIFNARIKQYKDYFGDFHHDGSIKYNQTAELVDSEMFGEHLKSLIRKIGNHTKRAIYTFEKIDDVPEVGTVVDGYSVYDVAMRIFENKVVATVCYVKYAELSQYIGVKNPWKDSDVSVNKCYNRAVSYNEFLLFTHDENKQSSATRALTWAGLDALVDFKHRTPLTCVEATGYTADSAEISTVLLPVISLAIGNSLFFQWSYQDNYSAGYMSEKTSDKMSNALSGTKFKRAQKAVRYCDMYGRMETYDFALMPTGPQPEKCGWINNDGSLVTDAATVARNLGYSLPLKPKEICNKYESWADGELHYSYNDSWEGKQYIIVSDLLIQKNSSEALTFSVQLHFCTDNENFIIGSGLTNFNSLVGGAAKYVELYGFNRRLNIFNRHVSISNATRLNFFSYGRTPEITPKIVFHFPVDINNYQAWALVGEDENGNRQIIFGENRGLDGADFKTTLYLLPMRKVV